MTHAHPIALACCAAYTQIAAELLKAPQRDIDDLVAEAFTRVGQHPGLASNDLQEALHEVQTFGRGELPTGSGYVVDSLWTALWALQQGTDYLSAVRAAISLGNDTDTSSCICGALAGVRWGLDSVPADWWRALRWPVESRQVLQATFGDPLSIALVA